MANEAAIKDPNRVYTMVVANPAGNETRNLKTGPGEAGLGIELLSKLDPQNDTVGVTPFAHNYTIITTATTTVVKNTSGVLREVRVLGGTLGNLTIYDNGAASGATPYPTNMIAAPGIALQDLGFLNGLTLVTTTAMYIIVIWR